MAPTSLHVLLPRNDPSLREIFRHFPAKVWMVFKSILFGLALIAAVCAVFIGGFLLIVITYRCGWEFLRWLRDVKWREKAGHLRRIERIDRLCKCLECW